MALNSEENEKMVPTKTIQTILKELDIKEEQVTLIKVDTDGYDYDCILSCGDMLQNNAPLLYWENYLETYEQMNSYNEMYESLSEYGYSCFFVFDNFGNYIGKMNKENCIELNNYLMRTIIGYSPRSFYYVDILACKNEQEELCVSFINEYLKEYRLNRFL